eukprot:Nitzschia sp. Nitz4//scaffold119_size111653//78566//82018//NITZ4_004204-RA/size111653-processed-gene-0.172-mRNA-1//1//CDS//3329533878//9118//frame0
MSQKRGSNPLDERFKVLPDDAYPNTYMSREELRQEMNQKSVYFHDTRAKHHKGKELGQVRLEILQCFGVPCSKLTRESSVYCVAVCANHAFKTDVMPHVANPMWLAKMRRACLFPVNHAYSRLFIGVFDDASQEEGDDEFVGRICIDISRLRPGCSYDFTLPLRVSPHVFTRQPRGSIRVRLHLIWQSERDAVMSYIPTAPPTCRPDDSVFVSCLDDQSFRCVALTVHGSHMPGKFSLDNLKATVREVNFTRIHIMRYLRQREIWNLVYWKYPFISGFVFLAWMHSVYANTMRYVPGHILTFLILHLYKNYAYYCMDSVLQNGFVTLTIEELAKAVLFGGKRTKKKHLEPLNMEVDRSYAKNPLDYVGQDNGAVQIADVADAMRKSIRVQDHKHRLKTYKNCFTGTEAVDFLVRAGFAQNRQEAEILGQRVARETRIFDHVAKRFDFEDRPHFYQFLDYDTKRYVIKGHKPLGKNVFKLIGFLNDEDAMMEGREHAEFPFATGVDHPRFTVKQSIAPNSTEKKKEIKELEKCQDTADCAEFGVTTSRTQQVEQTSNALTNAAGEVVHVAGDVLKAGVGVVRAGVRRASLLGGMNNAAAAAKDADEGAPAPTPEKTNTRRRNSFLGNNPDNAPAGGEIADYGDPMDIYDKLCEQNNPVMDKILQQQQRANAYDMYAYDSDNDVINIVRKRNKSGLYDEKQLATPPLQEMYGKYDIGDKAFTKSVREARHKAHGLLLHAFNEHTYKVDQDLYPTYIQEEQPDSDSVASAKAKKKKKRNFNRLSIGHGKDKEAEEEPKKKRQSTPFDARRDECDKILHINKYSHPNPWMSRIGLIIQPMLEMVQAWLYLTRALFNIFTWQDPILSFWLATGGPIVVIALHIFPYRIALFILGFAVVGPQNYVLRLFREYKGDPPPNFDIIQKKRKLKKDERPEEIQYFSSVAPGNQTLKFVNVDPKQVKQVLVPYSPLKYNRFYDWPPEPEYSRVYPSPPPRNSIAYEDHHHHEDSASDDDGYLVDGAKSLKKKKKKKGIKKLASQMKKGTGTVVVVGGELANLGRTTTSMVAKGAVGLTTNVAKGTVNATKGAVKGTGKVAARGARGMLGFRKRKGGGYDYDSDGEY